MRDAIRAAGFNYGKPECEITGSDGRPPPRCGEWFIAVHGGRPNPGPANVRNLDELFDFNITMTKRVIGPLDRIGDQEIARNIARVPLGQRQGFNAKLEQLRAFLHMNWRITVLQGQTPASANDNLMSWASGTDPVYGFTTPARLQNTELPVLVGGEWLQSDAEALEFAMKSQISYVGARRFQPQTASVGVFQ